MLAPVQRDYGSLKLFIDGKWVDSKSNELQEVLDPAKDEVIAKVPLALKEEVDSAIQAAQKAFLKWRDVPVPTRAGYIYKLRNKLEEHLEELARVLVQDNGRTIGEARGEIRRSIENVETACAVTYTESKGEYLAQIAQDIDEVLVREPLGVFGIITPFNIPVHAWSSYVPYALALGCTVVVVPSRLDPVVMNWVFKIMEEVGFPPGVANLVHGGREVNKMVLSHPLTKGIGFIGGTEAGRALYEMAGKYGKRASINAGAKNYVVVMPDADLDSTVEGLMSASFGMGGQRCLSCANLLPVGDIYEPLKDRFVKAASNVRLGYGLDEKTELGSLISKQNKETIADYVEKGVANGARLLIDGRNPKVEGCPTAAFMGPTVFDEVSPDMEIAREELFGPVVCIMKKARTLNEAIEMVNTKTQYGHAASIFTSNGIYAREFAREADVGNIGVNVGVAQPMAFFPIGGRRQSFFGVLHSRIDTVRFFTDHKILVTRWSLQQGITDLMLKR